MAVRWRACTVGDFIEKGEVQIKTGPFGTQLHASDYVEQGTPVINVRNIGFGNIRSEDLEFIAPDTVKRLPSHLLEVGDIVFGRKGAVERHAFVRPDKAGWFQGSDCLRVRFRSPAVEPRFLSYCWLTENHKQWMMNQCSHGATMASLNQDIICRIRLRLPPIETQRKTVAILSAYDDLIENNTRRIRILEEMAQAIYREWFVHFRFPGHKKVKLIPSPLGPIPLGWSVAKLAGMADVNALSIQRGEEPEQITYIDIASVSPGSIDEAKRMKFEDAPGRARRIVRHGDIIWSMVRPNRRSFALVLDPEPNLIVSTGFAVVSATGVPSSYLYHALTTDEFVGYLANRATGAAYPAVKAEDFENAENLLPDETTLERFNESVVPMLEMRNTLAKKNRNLRRTRDLLLPKLISGELDVSDLDINVGDSAD
jgi:type I restriction enzyme S subunit